MKVLKDLLVYWQFLVIVITPLILLPLPIVAETEAARCAYVLLLTSVYWVFEVLPLPVTSLIPVGLLPLMGVMSTGAVAQNYMTGTCMLFVGSLSLALAIEKCNLHRRIALNVMRVIGTSPGMLILAFMLPTAFLSLWISNTATTAMIIPLMEAVLAILHEADDEDEYTEITAVDESFPIVRKGSEGKIAKKRRAMLAMSICFSANIGGTGTIIGTPPNLVLVNNLDDFDDQPVTFSSWMIFTFPILIVTFLATWMWLQFFYLGPPNWLRRKKNRIVVDEAKVKEVEKLIAERCDNLGPMRYSEMSVLVLFITLVLLWLTRSPGFFEGWGDALEDSFLPKELEIADATPGILIALLLFILPANPEYLNFFKSRKTQKNMKSSGPLLEWKTVETELAWGIILLLGGGFALAEASESSGLSEWIKDQLAGLGSMPDWTLSFILMLSAGLLTQVLSNTATSSVLLPVFKQLALQLKINPLYLMIPPTLMCSYAFMLPVSTGPNAIAFRSSGLSVVDMVKVGSVVTLICLLATFAAVNTYGLLMFDLNTFPSWAEQGQVGNLTIAL